MNKAIDVADLFRFTTIRGQAQYLGNDNEEYSTIDVAKIENSVSDGRERIATILKLGKRHE